jgi:alpha-N-arabinofuranosidase
MQGTSLDLGVISPSYDGVTVPAFIQKLDVHAPPDGKLTKLIDASAVLSPDGKEIRLAILNRSSTDAFDVPIRFFDVNFEKTIEVHEVYHKDLKATNSLEVERVKTMARHEVFDGSYHLKAQSFQGKCCFAFDRSCVTNLVSFSCSVVVFRLQT